MPVAVAVVLSAAVTALLCSFGPAVIRRLPEPAVESDSADKTPYPDIAARPRLAAHLAAGGAVVGGLVGWRPGWDSALVPWLYLGAVGVVLAYIDARTRLLPTRIIGPSYAVVAVLIGVASLIEGSAAGLMRAGLGWLAMGGCYVVLWLIYPRGLGYGDVRLSGLLGLGLGYVGWPALVTGAYSGFLIGGVGGGILALLRVVHHKHFPFGPFMLAGALVGLVWGETFADWYVSR